MISAVVSRFSEVFSGVLAEAAARDAHVDGFARAVKGIDALAARVHADLPVTHPALHYLPRAIDGLRVGPELAGAIRAVVPHLRWASSYSDKGAGAQVARRMCWAEVAGDGALVHTEKMRCGAFLLSPGLVYPLHGHRAEEIYYVASGTLRISHGFEGGHVTVEAPGYSITPSEMPHMVVTGAEPALVLYVWTGDLTAPTWWWEKNAHGDWVKIRV